MMRESDGDKTLIDLIKILWQSRWKILGLVFIATLLSIVISLLMPNFFKSSSVFYAASQDLAKPQPVGGVERDIDYYGNDYDIDRLLTQAHSHTLKSFLIDSFDLYSWYEVMKDSKNAEHKVREKLQKLMSIEKTKFGAVSLSVEDINPVKAYNMTLAATNFIDQSSSGQLKKSQAKLLDTYNQKIEGTESKIRLLNDSLMMMKKAYNIYDLTNQSEILLNQQSQIQTKDFLIKSKLSSSLIQNNADSLVFYNSLQSAIKNQLANINSKIDRFNEGVNPISTLERLQIQITKQIALDKERRDQLMASFQSPTPGIILVEEPEVAVYKSRPRRSLYVIGTAFLSSILVSLFFILLATYKQQDWS